MSHEVEPKRGGEHSRPVLLYIGVMFSVAMLLLLLSFLMQQRNHEDLMRSMTEVQNIVDLELETQALTQKLGEAQDQIAALSQELGEAAARADTLAVQAQALYALMEIRSAYERGQLTAAQTLYDSFPALEEQLSDELLSNIDWVASPLKSYEHLKEQLGGR